jgi:hypothetical protein
MPDESEAISKVAEFGSKLLDTVAPFFTPLHTVRQAKADAKADEIRAEGRIELARLEIERATIADRGLEERVLGRLARTEIWRQRNLEVVYGEALALPAPSEVSAEPVDPDWVASFIGHCQDVSHERMRTVWARILRREVANPGAFSLRTLAAVKLFSVADARLFSRFCSYVWQVPDGPVPILPNVVTSESGDAPILGMADLVNLETLGLIVYDGMMLMNWNTNESQVEVSYFGRRHRITSAKDGTQLDTFAFLTGVGAELASIAGADPHEGYRASTVSHWRATGLEIAEL